MSLDIATIVLSTLAGLGAVVLITSSHTSDPPPGRTISMPRRDHAVRVAAAASAGTIALALSGWLLPAALCGGAAWLAVVARQRRGTDAVDEVEKTDAIASWIENLRDVLVAGDQPVGAIQSTVSTCPPLIRPQVRRLAVGLGRQEPGAVFRRFADEIDDPLGDLVAAGLLIAVQRGARTAAVLSTLAEQARRQADRRRLIAAEHAPVRREVTLVTLIMGSLVVGLFLFGRAEYLAAYDSTDGQLFLAAVLVIYALLLVRVRRLARAPRPSRFLTGSPESRFTTHDAVSTGPREASQR